MAICAPDAKAADIKSKKGGSGAKATMIKGFCPDRTITRDEKGRYGIYWSCKDGSVSYDQPESRGQRTGLCGPTAGTNLIRAYCNDSETVEDFDYYFVDLIWGATLPFGSTPKMMRGALNLAWNFYCDTLKHDVYEWRVTYRSDAKDYLEYLYSSLNWNRDGFFKRKLSDGSREQKWPLLALLNWGEKKNLGHYVAVVDIESKLDLSNLSQTGGSLSKILENADCKVRFNSWEDQYSLSCLDFARWASAPNFSRGIRGLAKYAIVDLTEK